VIEALLFLLLLSACGRLLRIEWLGWAADRAEASVTGSQK
jgi:hypothetical protein